MERRENVLKKYLLGVMGTRWSAQSHEDKHSTGIPDLSYGISGINGWIELKQIENWPKLISTLVKPKKYTPEQVNWILQRGRKGGHCYIMIKVGRSEYFLFNYTEARIIRQGTTKEWYYDNAIAKWNGPVIAGELIEALT